MLRPKSRVSAVTPKIILLLLSYLFLVSAAIFGLVGSYRVDVLRTDLAKVNAARDAAEHRETEFKTREAAVAGAEAIRNRLVDVWPSGSGRSCGAQFRGERVSQIRVRQKRIVFINTIKRSISSRCESVTKIVRPDESTEA